MISDATEPASSPMRTSEAVPRSARNDPRSTGGEIEYVNYLSGTEGLYASGRSHTPEDSGPRSRTMFIYTPDLKSIEKTLINNVRERLREIEHADEVDEQNILSVLTGIIYEMWDSAKRCSVCHRDILIALESGVMQASNNGTATSKQLQFFGDALDYLSTEFLIRENAEIIRSAFVGAGFSPLGFLND